MANNEETKTVLLTLPTSWLKAIDAKATGLKSRQDIIRDWIEPNIKN